MARRNGVIALALLRAAKFQAWSAGAQSVHNWSRGMCCCRLVIVCCLIRCGCPAVSQSSRKLLQLVRCLYSFFFFLLCLFLFCFCFLLSLFLLDYDLIALNPDQRTLIQL